LKEAQQFAAKSPSEKIVPEFLAKRFLERLLIVTNYKWCLFMLAPGVVATGD
jgi:hypothetical protein